MMNSQLSLDSSSMNM